MKSRIVFAGMVLALFSFKIKAQSFSVDMGTVTNYLSHGRTLSRDLPCFQPSVGYTFLSGTMIYTWFSLPYDRTTSFNDEYNLIVEKSVQLFDEQPYWTINMHGFADYWLNPRTSNPAIEPDIYHGMKYNAGVNKSFALHKGAGIKMTTGYDFYYYQSFGIGGDILKDAGIHEFLVNFNKSFENVEVATKSVISNNRGAIDPNINPGWAYFSQHLSLLLKTSKVSLRASINYQWTLEKTVHSENLLWFTLNLSQGFKI